MCSPGAPEHLEAARHALGPRAHVLRSDAASRADIAALGARVAETLGQIDAVFVNAGFARLTALEETDESVYDLTFDVNTKGPFFLVQRLAPLVRDGGAFVFTTSVADVTGTPGMGVYSGSKAALRSFARVFAAELAPRGIRVNAVSPGYIKTPTMGVSGASAEDLADFERLGAQETPLRRLGAPEEAARAALVPRLRGHVHHRSGAAGRRRPGAALAPGPLRRRCLLPGRRIDCLRGHPLVRGRASRNRPGVCLTPDRHMTEECADGKGDRGPQHLVGRLRGRRQRRSREPARRRR